MDAFVGAVVSEVASWTSPEAGPSSIVPIVAISTLEHTQVESGVSVCVGWAVLEASAR